MSIAIASPSDFLACAELSCAEDFAADVRRVAVLPLGLLPDFAGAPAVALVSGADALAPGAAALAGTVPDIALVVFSGEGGLLLAIGPFSFALVGGRTGSVRRLAHDGAASSPVAKGQRSADDNYPGGYPR
ncbi:hypothetical protein [Novosphingobium pokkalii]|uniref:Uncharacterized protein n=1 Tax=Novosphingobium pokkalii TaxID=1770194 RepID=A0ABV7V1L5_9SPHN|nr:hypothetical protein [Novosphingobium pokkalii]